MFIAFAIVAYLSIGALMIYLIERFDGPLTNSDEYSVIFMVFFAWPIVITLYVPVLIAEHGRKQRLKKMQ